MSGDPPGAEVKGPASGGPGRTLVGERAATLGRIEALSRDFDVFVDGAELVATDDEHDPEGHTIAFERQQVAALLRDARRHLVDIDDALARITAGTYGVCEGCGAPVGAARLAARPTARTCITCAS